MSLLAVKADEQGTKLVDPSKTALRSEATFIDIRIEQAFASAFGGLAMALVFWDVGNKPMIEAGFAGIAGIKGCIGVEICAPNGQSQRLHLPESDL